MLHIGIQKQIHIGIQIQIQFKPTLSSQDERVTDLHAAGLLPCLQIQIHAGIEIQIHTGIQIQTQFNPTFSSQLTDTI